MTGEGLRRAAARALRWLLRVRTREFTPDRLGRSAVIFAPHPDDEVLGCGGLIAAKRGAGAAVTIVFMTDGRRSHCAFVEAAELARLRRAEALAAAGILGVAPGDVVFLEFEDKGLDDRLDGAVARSAELLRRHVPDEVFLPFSHDWHQDHVATSVIVRRALALAGCRARVYEYSVYLWKAWPFSRDAGFEDGLTPSRVLRSAVLIARMASRATDRMTIREPGRKRAALQAHRTQTEKPPQHPAWRVLGEWGGGDFLGWHLSGAELFARRSRP